MTGPKLNERPVLRTRPDGPARAVETPGVTTRAVARYVRMSAYKVREVLDLVRGQDVEQARAILRFSERDAASVVGKVLASAVANAEHNDAAIPEELFVSACFADEGPTMKRWRPRARGRATRIRKRTCHITLVVSRLPEDELRRRRAARPGGDRRRRRGGQEATGRAVAEPRSRLRRRGRAAQPEPSQPEPSQPEPSQAEAAESEAAEAAATQEAEAAENEAAAAATGEATAGGEAADAAPQEED
jgi:large subunit ribosomal protein L22